MTYHIIEEHSLTCDGPGCCQESFVAETERSMRRWAAVDGWTAQEGRDFCPECSKAVVKMEERE